MAPPPRFQLELPVRFSDTDMMGHVNHARFLSYLEDARIAYLAAVGGAGGDLMQQGCILAHLEIDYVRPLQFTGDPIAVDVTLDRVGRSSLAMSYTISQGDELAARATSVLVAYDYRTAASRPLSDAERASLVPLITA